MLIRTHLAVGMAAALYFLPHVNDKVIFFVTVIIATLIPEFGAVFSMRKNNSTTPRILKPLLTVMKTYTFTLIVALVLALFYPVFALPFFIGYSFHLFLDTFTVEGIRPYWPFKKVSSGRINTGSKVDMTIFIIFLIFDVALLVKLFI